MKIDLACGNNKVDGYIGVDKVKLDHVDIVHDLNIYPYPFEDNSIDEMVCNHFIEHVADISKFIDECYRILKNKSKMIITAPYYTSIRAWQDPTHIRAISEATFLYFNKKWREDNKLQHYDIKSDFDYSYGYIFPIGSSWVMKSEEARNFAITHYNNVVNDIQICLIKKGD